MVAWDRVRWGQKFCFDIQEDQKISNQSMPVGAIISPIPPVRDRVKIENESISGNGYFKLRHLGLLRAAKNQTRDT